MPKWIHDRAAHIRAKTPGMSESTSWAIATQQSHALGKSPKGYGTSEGKRTAKAKFTGPRKSYTQTADPKKIGAKQLAAEKAKTAMELSDMAATSYEMCKLAGFHDEMQKIAAAGMGPVGRAARRVGELVMGGKASDVVKHVDMPQPGRLAKMFGAKAVPAKQVTVEGVGPRAGNLGLAGLKDKSTRDEAMKSLAARTAVGAGGIAAGERALKGHRKKERQQLGRAYVHGARDMYARVGRNYY